MCMKLEREEIWASYSILVNSYSYGDLQCELNLDFFSDKPGNHDFSLLKKLVLPDGSILRCELPGRPTRDCLFDDPTRDGKRCALYILYNSLTNVGTHSLGQSVKSYAKNAYYVSFFLTAF